MLTLPQPDEFKELCQLRDTTWLALNSFVLDHNDNKNVIRYEKLSKLYLALCKQISKLNSDKPKETANKLDEFLSEAK